MRISLLTCSMCLVFCNAPIAAAESFETYVYLGRPGCHLETLDGRPTIGGTVVGRQVCKGKPPTQAYVTDPPPTFAEQIRALSRIQPDVKGQRP